jgi:hypothetical protein
VKKISRKFELKNPNGRDHSRARHRWNKFKLKEIQCENVKSTHLVQSMILKQDLLNTEPLAPIRNRECVDSLLYTSYCDTQKPIGK